MANEDSSVAIPQVGPGSDEAGIDSGIGAAYVEPTPAREATTPQATAAALFVVLLLVLSTTSQGAFAVSRWAPLALLTVAVVIGSVAVRRGVTVRSAPAKAALAAIWALAAYALLSMLWAKSQASAWEAANRTILYAAMATLPFALPMPRRSLAMVAWATSAGICLIALYTLGRLLFDGPSMFLAGRLNGPVNYRNATALLFALPVWPLIIAVARHRGPRLLRALAMAGATLCLGLAFLTQSRGIVIGLAVGGCVALAVGPERVRRAWVAVVAVLGIAVASPWLLKPFHAFDGGHGTATGYDITVAATALLVITVLAFLVGMAMALFDNGLRADSPQMGRVRRAARGCLALGAVLVLVGALAAVGNPATFVSRKWDQFHNLNAGTPTSTRLLSTGGQRYDLWRVALKEFAGAPLVGVGADNYASGYYRYRRTDRNLNDPHSLVFALLSEDGIIGTALFVVFLAGIAVTLARGWPRLDDSARRNALAPAAAAAVLLGQSLVDWIWLIPGLTAIGVLLLAVAAAQAVPGGDERATEPPSRRRAGASRALALRLGALALLGLAAVSVLAFYLSDAYIQRARSVASNPSAELSAARNAATLNPWSVTPHYLEASALEGLGRRTAARDQLDRALSLEPQNFATLGVLGDFEARTGSLAAARRFYRRALALNPLDTGLQQLVTLGKRRSAKRRHGHRSTA